VEKQSTDFARELHYSIGACLVSMKMSVARLARRAATPDTKEIAEDLGDLIIQATGEMRRIASQLRPSVLDHTALPDALARDLEQFARRTSIACTFECEDPNITIWEGAVVGVYRIFQEALSNIARHAGASNVQVRLSQTDKALLLEVIDDGRGMPPAADATSGLGLQGMRERAKGMGATIVIARNRDAGTRLLLRVPRQPVHMSGK
jgi:signal transduction histidine kinase